MKAAIYARVRGYAVPIAGGLMPDYEPTRFLPPPEPPKGDEVFRAFDRSCTECNSDGRHQDVSKPLKIYLAAKYSRNAEMRMFRDHIEGIHGHRVICRWIEGNHQLTDIKNDPEYTRFAREDFQDLSNSDVVLWFSEPEKIEGRNRGGRHVEFGIALAYGIPIIVIGRKENVFHWLPEVRHVAELSDAMNLIKEMCE